MAGLLLSHYAAMDPSGVIGNGNALPWPRLEGDLPLFKKYTTGKPVGMGAKTWLSLPRKPLPNRPNIIISRSLSHVDGAIVCPSIDSAIEKAAQLGEEFFIIGGGEIFKQTLDKVQRIYMSHVKKEYPGDVQYPTTALDGFRVMHEEDYPDFTFRIWERK